MLSPILACADVEKAVAYYTQQLGFETVFHMPASDTDTEFACVNLGEAQILLGVTEGFVSKDDMDKRGTGIQIYINLPESMPIDSFYKQAKAKGAAISKAIETREWGEMAFNVDDLDGYHLMFAQQHKPAD